MTRGRIRSVKKSLALLAVALGVLALSTTAASAGAARTHPTKSQDQRFLFIQNDPNAAPIALAFGPVIHARGTDKVIDDTHDVFTFPAGSIKVVHTPKRQHQSFDKATCLGVFKEWGTYKITGGTKAYKDAHGHGTYVVRVLAVGCNPNATPDLFQLRIWAHGPLHV